MELPLQEVHQVGNIVMTSLGVGKEKHIQQIARAAVSVAWLLSVCSISLWGKMCEAEHSRTHKHACAWWRKYWLSACEPIRLLSLIQPKQV